MKITRLALTALACAISPALLADSKLSLITSVHSKVLNGYKRAKNKDGSFQREYYALSIGGHLSGTLRDSSIEKVELPQLVGVLGQALAQQNYHLARDSKSAELLLLVNWGKTIPDQNTNHVAAMNDLSRALFPPPEPPSGADNPFDDGGARVTFTPETEALFVELQMFRTMREQAFESNARLLGYIDAVNQVVDRVPKAGDDVLNDLIGDLEEPRYYLFVSAYDFREMVERKNRKLLWATRVSIRAPGNAFHKDFAAMLAKASKHFGQDSGGLLRRYDPRGRVDIGDIEVIGMTPDPATKTGK